MSEPYQLVAAHKEALRLLHGIDMGTVFITLKTDDRGRNKNPKRRLTRIKAEKGGNNPAEPDLLQEERRDIKR